MNDNGTDSSDVSDVSNITITVMLSDEKDSSSDAFSLIPTRSAVN